MAHFPRLQRIPWCAALLRDPNFTPTVTQSREPKASTEDSFFAETLQSDRTIRSCLSLQRTPSSPSSTSASDGPPISEVRVILELGDGVAGHPHICHGGFVATMLDEAMGVLLTVNVDEVKRRDPNGPGRLTAFTAWLNTKYYKPVPAPGVVLATARFERVEGRKMWITASIEDGEGTVLAGAEAMFIEPKAKL